MSAPRKPARPFVIVVGIDYSELGELALAGAIATARSHEHAWIHVVHVVGGAASSPHVGTIVEPDFTRESEKLREYVEAMLVQQKERAEDGGRAPFERLTTHVRIYRAAEAIAQLAADVNADLVVVGTHGRHGFEHFRLGSVAEGTVNLAPCPVLVVRQRSATPKAAVPEVEPACPRCLETRRTTDGRDFWCEQHREQHGRRHTYHFGTAPSSHQSGLLIRL